MSSSVGEGHSQLGATEAGSELRRNGMAEAERRQGELYDRVGAEYDRRYQGAYGRYHRRLETDLVLGFLPTNVGVLLDLGTGTGRIPIEMQGRVHLALGIDLSREALRVASVKRIRNSSFICMNARQLALPDGSVDSVTCLGLLEYVSDPRPYFAEAARVLRPGGVFCFTCYNRYGWVRALQERWSRRLRHLSGRSVEAPIRTGGASFSKHEICALLSECSFTRIQCRSTYHTAPVWFASVPRRMAGLYRKFVVWLNLGLQRVFPGGGAVWIVAAQRS